MPNKTLTFKTDILPYSSEGYNIGNSTNKWKVNGYTVSAAAEKNVDATLLTSSTNLPTSAAVANYIESLGHSALVQQVINVPANSWTGNSTPYTTTVSCSYATSSNTIIVGHGASTKEQYDAFSAANIQCTAQANGSITLAAYDEKPSITLPVCVTVLIDGVDISSQDIRAYIIPAAGIPASDLADSSITKTKLDSNLQTTVDDVSDLKSALGDIKNLVISDEQLSGTENCSYTQSTGYMLKNGSVQTGGSYDQYRYTSKISVNPGDVISFTFTSAASARVITAFSDNTAVAASGADSVTGTYTVPNGINGIVVTFYVGGISEIKRTYTNTLTTIKSQPGTTGLVYQFDVSSNNFAGKENLQDMINYSIQFRGDVDTFNGLIIAHGYNEYMGGYIKITPTMFEYYLGTEESPRLSEAHNLTITDYIAIRITSEYNSANFYVYTNGGSYSKTNQAWDVRKGVLSVRSIGTNVLTNCVLSYNCKGWSNPIHLYGNSYFGLYNDKWTHYMYNASMKDYNLNGYPGRGSKEAYTSARLALNHSFPKKIIWCLGMNDGDNGAINTAWKTAVDALIATCEERGIELILATIPNVPTVDNSYKNAYVIASGLRYIDFAGAVGAESGTTWYSGMLSNDGVHPSEQGAIALFNQAIADVPELMQ